MRRRGSVSRARLVAPQATPDHPYPETDRIGECGDRLEVFLRVAEARLEVPAVQVRAGRASFVLIASGDKRTGVFLGRGLSLSLTTTSGPPSGERPEPAEPRTTCTPAATSR